MSGHDDIGRRLCSASDPATFLALWFEDNLLPAVEQGTFEAFYRSFRKSFPPRIRRYYSGQLTEVTAMVRGQPGALVLEVGCGCGSESLWLALQGARVYGIDVRADRVAVAESRAEVLSGFAGRPLPVQFASANFLDLPAEPSYDIIWMEQTFHHLEPRRRVVEHLARLVRPGGHLVVSEANGWNPLLQLQLLLRRGVRTVVTFTGEDGREHVYGNERVLSALALSELLGRVGFRRQRIRHFRSFPNHPLFSPLGRAEALLEHNFLAPLLTHYNYVGRRVEHD